MNFRLHGTFLLWQFDNKVGGYLCRSQVSVHEILKAVRMDAPIITEFFDNEKEMAKFQKWREEYEEKERLEKAERAKKKRERLM